MIVLGIDAALGSFSAAILRSGEPAVSVELPGSVALERGLHAVAATIREANASPRMLDRLAVGLGPGSFTGSRIAISYAKSLAQGWRRPLVGISSFDAIEADVAVDPSAALLTVVRGRKGVVSVRLRGPAGMQRLSGYVADVIGALEAPPGSVLQVLGNAEDVRAALGERGFVVHYLERAVLPTALAVATVASRRDPARSLHEIRADYGELPAVKIPSTVNRGALGEHSN